MKKALLILLYAMFLAAANAQDKIITVQKDTIECRIISVGGERINYEQKSAENFVVGKSILLSDVLHYYRVGQHEDILGFQKQKIRRPKPEFRSQITLQGGLARSFFDFTDVRNQMLGFGIPASETDNYISGLKNGYHVNAGFHYLLNTFMGVGVDYSLFYSASKGEFLITKGYAQNIMVYGNSWQNEKFYSQFAGASVLFQQFLDEKKKIKVSETVSPGFVFSRIESRGIEHQLFLNDYGSTDPKYYYDKSNTLVSGNTFGIKGGLSVEYCFTSQFSAGLAGNFMWANLRKISFKSRGYSSGSQELNKNMDISNINYGFSVRYLF